MNKLQVFKQSRETIRRNIQRNPMNDMHVIRSIETLLLKKRGSVFSMPKSGSPVIALLSGGLDTTVVIAMLLDCYKLDVYPLFINRGLPHGQRIRESIDYYSQYFRTKYPTRYHSPFEIRLDIPPKECKSVLLRAENDIIAQKNRKGIPLQPVVYANTAVYYAKYLQETCGIKPRTIFGGWLPSNSEWYGYESITSLRSIMLNLCVVDSDYSWQFTSLPMEKELGYYFDKDALVKIGSQLALPLDKTWTCFLGGSKQCGQCPPCSTRKLAFQQARIIDTTRYYDGLNAIQRLRKQAKKMLQSLI